MKRKIFFLLLIILLISCAEKRDIKIAKKMIKENNFYDAIHVLENLENKDSEVYFYLGEANIGLRKFSIADSFYNLAIRNNPELKNRVVSSYSKTALTEFLRGYNYSAILYWQKVLNLNPNYDLGVGFYYLGKHYFEQDSFDVSKRMLLNSINLNLVTSERINLFKMVINIYDQEMHYDSALFYSKTANMEFENTSEDFWVEIGVFTYKKAEIEYSKKNYDEAMNLINEFIKIGKPQYLLDDAYFVLGNIYFDLQDFQKAIQAYNKVKEYSTVKYSGSRDTYSQSKEQLDKIQQVEEKLKKIIERTNE